MDYLAFPGETQFIGFIRANYGHWFAQLLDQSQFNRRLRKLSLMLEMLHRKWVKQLGVETLESCVIDPKPIPIMGYRRSKKHSDFYGSADYDYCAARKMNARHAASQAPKCNRVVEVFRLQIGHALNPRGNINCR